MRKILRQQNLDLLRQLELAKESISKANITEEMYMYHQAVLEICDSLLRCVYQNLRDLDGNEDDIIDDVRSETQNAIMRFNLFNEQLVGPIRRFLPSDRLCLKILDGSIIGILRRNFLP